MTMNLTQEQLDKRRAASRAWYRRHLEEQRLRSRIKGAKAYSEHREMLLQRNREWASKNAEKIKTRQKQYRIENREKRIRQQKEWYAKNGPKWRKEYFKRHPGLQSAMTHKRRALKRAATVNLKNITEWVDSIKSARFAVCYYCQKTVPVKMIHFDHIVPLSGGGSHSVDNLCVACSHCNLSKSDKPIRTWIKVGQQMFEL